MLRQGTEVLGEINYIGHWKLMDGWVWSNVGIILTVEKEVLGEKYLDYFR